MGKERAVNGLDDGQLVTGGDNMLCCYFFVPQLGLGLGLGI